MDIINSPPSLSERSQGMPPKILIQWPQSPEARRVALMQGLPMGASSQIRQRAIKWHDECYPLAFALADLVAWGPHANKLLVQIGWTGEAVRQGGGWFLKEGSEVALWFDTPSPSTPSLLEAAWDLRLSRGSVDEAVLARRMDQAARFVEQYREHRTLQVAEDVERARNTPLNSREAFERLSRQTAPAPVPAPVATPDPVPSSYSALWQTATMVVLAGILVTVLLWIAAAFGTF